MELISPLLMLAFISVHCSAYVYFLNTNWTGITYDTSFQLRWVGDGTPVNISLMHGPDDNMVFVRNITVNNAATTVDWNPSDVNPTGNYSLVIHQACFSLSSPRFEMMGAISRVPATMVVVVTMTPPVLPAASELRLGPTDSPRIVIEGREADAAGSATTSTSAASLHAHSRPRPADNGTQVANTTTAVESIAAINIAEGAAGLAKARLWVPALSSFMALLAIF